MTVRQLFTDNRNRPESNYAAAVDRLVGQPHPDDARRPHYDVQGHRARERQMLRLWIDVGAPYPGTYAALGSGSIGGYAQNQLVNTDTDWPTTQAGAEVIDRRCAGCHQGDERAAAIALRRARPVVLAIRASTTRG